MPEKRSIGSFFSPPAKKRKSEQPAHNEPLDFSSHSTYPFPIAYWPEHVGRELSSLPARPGRDINDQLDLDLTYYEPYIPPYLEKEVFHFLRSRLPFYRVKYTIKRGTFETNINTPRYTTVFGLDETSRFDQEGQVIDATTKSRVPASAYARYSPRPIPKCLDDLRKSTETATGCTFNFCLVNYYASGSDSISYHSDDEKFLGPEPAIASFSLGAKRDFYMKHKPLPATKAGEPPHPDVKPLKLPLTSGDMILMKGKTQSCWLHSIPKRTGKNEHDGGRINITFRKAMVKGGTDNYYNYNVGTGPVYVWSDKAREMALWDEDAKTL